MSGTLAIGVHIMAFGGPAEVLKLVEAKRPVLAIDEDEIEVELPQNVDDPWGWERKVVSVLASRRRDPLLIDIDTVGPTARDDRPPTDPAEMDPVPREKRNKPLVEFLPGERRDLLLPMLLGMDDDHS
jgi:hypothetical protein